MNIIHLVGSSTSELYAKLSYSYYYSAEEVGGTNNYVLEVDHKNRLFLKLPDDSDSHQISLPQLIEHCTEIDLVVPYMFCKMGMTSYRSFFEDILNIPVVGSPASTTALATSKWNTRCVALAAGVNVPDGELLQVNQSAKYKKPCVVKPDTEDNSLGVTLVTEESQMESAIKYARNYDSQIIVEDFVPGREIRAAVIEDEGALRVLPFIEYHVSNEHPIRLPSDKFSIDKVGKLKLASNQPDTMRSSCPAELDAELGEKVSECATKMHIALGCRDYSLFDFRIKEQDNTPLLLEAGLFWTFSPPSIISRMLATQGSDLEKVYRKMWNSAAKRKR